MGILLGILQVLWILGVNAIPAWGYFSGRWGAGTALVLYWCENVIGIVLVAFRIAIHRRLTHTAGHEIGLPGSSVTVDGRPTHGSLLTGFLVTALAFAAAHGIFLAALLAIVPEFRATGVDLGRVREVLPPMAFFLFLGFLGDLVGIRRRPFAWIRGMTERVLQRTIVVHLTLLFGMFIAAFFHASRGFVALFVALKLLTDLSSVIPQWNPETPPAGLVRFLDQFRGAGQESFGDYWRQQRNREEKEERDEERVVPPGGAGLR